MSLSRFGGYFPIPARGGLRFTLLAAAVLLIVLTLAGARDAGAGGVANTYTVDTTVDDPNLSTCSSAPADCSLRAAINRSNADNIPGTVIRFTIGVGFKTITVSAVQGALPAITAPVTIDGTTQICSIANPHPPCITISGAVLSNADGLLVQSSGVNIKGLAIVFFANGAAIDFSAGSGGIVTRSFLGTADGVTSAPNFWGIRTLEGVGSVTIGGPTISDRNIISGSLNYNVELDGHGAVLQNNYIGLTMNGQGGMPDNRVGVEVFGDGNHIGKDGIGNVISGNSLVGVNIAGGIDNHIESNLIGTDTSGTTGVGNAVGISLGGDDNFVGGDQPGQGNVISGNTLASGNISFPDGTGILARSDGNTIQGNRIGTNAAGDAAIPNTVGVQLGTIGMFGQQAFFTTIGGDSPGARNIISGNSEKGILVTNGIGTVISGNYIGTNAGGDAAIPNQTGIFVGEGGSNTTIGGGSAGQRNVISGNNPLNGIFVTGASTVISGNFVGTNAGGDTAVPNGGGIALLNATDALVGGDGAGERNVVAGGSTYGISLLNVSGAVISGNYVGVDSAGSVALPNGNGIVLSRSSSNQIVGNVTSGNTGAGIRVETVAGNPSLDNNLTDNIIGLSAAGSSAVPNGGAGIQITNADGGAATGNTISENSIDGNGGLGIDINSTDPIPDPPVLTEAEAAGANSHVTGTFSGPFANETIIIEFFTSPACDPSGNGEGRTFLATKNVNTDGSGDATIDVNVPQAAPGQVITATARDEDGSTSEFSNCVTVTGATPTPSPTPTTSPSLTPTPTATPTVSPTPTATPTPTPTGTTAPELTQGDVDCNGGVTSVDALKELRHVAQLPVSQNEPCPDIGTNVASVWGDVDCSGEVTSVDALKVLRFVASLPVSQTEPCPDIGEEA